MKNITLSVEDEVYQLARVEAAKRRTSVSAIVRGYLRAFARGQAPVVSDDPAREDQQCREELAGLFRQANLVLGYKPARDKSYER